MKDDFQNEFNVLNRIYSLFTDIEKKEKYDKESKVDEPEFSTIEQKWLQHLKPVHSEDLLAAKARYVGSKDEENDIIRLMKNGNGSMTHLFNYLPFMRFEDESRIVAIVKRLMQEDKIDKKTIRKINK